jgi:peptidoglycan/LPS O-acetylase OafA/YrhL
VVVFFVLSGFVIAHTVSRPDQSFALYAQHRLARIWSVAIPALLLAFAVAWLAAEAPVNAAATARSAMSVLVNDLFLGQVWTLDVPPPADAPYWSVNYEVWYYIIFGLWTYARPRWRGPAVLMACAAAGPKILLLMPVWLLGVAIYRIPLALSPRQARALFLLTLVAGLLLFWFDTSISIRVALTSVWPWFTSALQASNQFIGDFLLGVMIAGNLFAVSRMPDALAPILAWKRPIKTCASFTFSAYLYHTPLFILLWDVARIHAPFVVVPALALGIVLLGLVTERRLPAWRNALRRAMHWFSRHVPLVTSPR